MAEIIKICSLDIPELAVYSKLTQAQLKNMQLTGQGLFIAEGVKTAEIALKEGIKPLSLLIEEKHINGKARELIEACGNVPVYTGSKEVLSSLTGYDLTRGVLCAMQRPAPLSIDRITESSGRIAVLENIVDASNLGAIFRSAAALGMDGILLSPSCCDPLYRKAIRASMGTVFQIPWARIELNWPGEAFAMLQKRGFKTAALALCDNAVDIMDKKLSSADKLAIILGTEGSGLMKETVDLSDYAVYIPMHAGVDSLNVAAAAAIAFWQLRNK